MIRKTAHSYEKQFSGKFGQIRDFIVIDQVGLEITNLTKEVAYH